MPKILRTRFAKDIVAEFLPPYAKSWEGRLPRKPSRKVVILCSGMPSSPRKDAVLSHFSAKGYWVFSPRYRGSWESGGEFMKISPHQDILDIIDQLPRGFRDLWSGKKLKVKPEKLFVIGSSFGGAVALLVSSDPRVTKVVALSPLVDWQYPSRDEPLDKFIPFVRLAFEGAYRGWKKHYRKIFDGKFFNPIANAEKVAGKKVYIIHAQDDRVCSVVPVKKIARLTGCRLTILKRGGHMGANDFLKKGIDKKMSNFLKSAS